MREAGPTDNNYQDSISDVLGIDLRNTDPTLLRLPHPKRLALTGAARLFETMLGEHWPRVAQLLGDTSLPRGDAVRLLLDTIPAPEDVLTNVPGTTNLGAIESFAIPTRYRLMGGRICHVADDLNEQLKTTDIGEDAPCQFLRLPWPAAYFEFGGNRELDPNYRVSNVETGVHVLEGAYITSVDWTPPESRNPASLFQRLGLAHGESCRLLEICLIGSPVGKRGILDDAVSYFNLYVRERDEERPLGDVLRDGFTVYRRALRDLPGVHVATADEEDEIHRGVTHLAKVLLYLNCDSLERTDDFAEEALRRRLTGLGPRKQVRLARRLMHVYDRIVIRARASTRHAPAASGRTVATHLRRGHFRLARVGVQRSQRKLVWIPPMLINATPNTDMPTKDYEIC